MPLCLFWIIGQLVYRLLGTVESAVPPDSAHLPWQVLWLFVLAIPVACVAWTITHEEVFREVHEYCKRCSQQCRHLLQRKFFYFFTCEYCLSHYVSIFFVGITGFKLLLDNWLGYVLAVFGLVWVANLYMSFYSRLRVDIRAERAEADARQKDIEIKEQEIARLESELERWKPQD